MASFGNPKVRFGHKNTALHSGKRITCGNTFKVNCSKDREMDVSTSALVDGIADCLNGLSACSFVVVVVILCMVHASELLN